MQHSYFLYLLRLTAIVRLLLKALYEIIIILKKCKYPEMNTQNECVSKLRLRQGHQAQSGTHFLSWFIFVIIRTSSIATQNDDQKQKKRRQKMNEPRRDSAVQTPPTDYQRMKIFGTHVNMHWLYSRCAGHMVACGGTKVKSTIKSNEISF